jgi:tRNA1Val (adenine37-N6)-methyltransferase
MFMRDETLDSLITREFCLIQDRSGYRFSMDPLLLAYFTKVKEGERVADLGSGNGIIALLLSKLYANALFLAVEIQPRLADQALRNSILNKVSHRVSILHEDLQHLPRLFQAGSFDVIVSNPPYRALHSGRVNPNPYRAKARHEMIIPLEAFISTVSFLLKNGGRAYFMFPSPRLAELITLLRNYHLEPKTLRLLYSDHSSESRNFIIEAHKNRKTGLRIFPPFILYQPKGTASENLRSIYTFYHQKINSSS